MTANEHMHCHLANTIRILDFLLTHYVASTHLWLLRWGRLIIVLCSKGKV